MSPDNLYIVVASVYTMVIGYDVYHWFRDKKIVTPKIRLERLRSKINVSVLITGLTMLVVSILFHVNILRYSKPVSFSEIENITLRDFKGYRKPFQTLDGEKRFAFITTTIDYEKVNNQVRVDALFHPARSYVYNEKSADRFILKHELYHFRITEIFARKCRKELSAYAEPPTDEMIEEIAAGYDLAEDEMQYDYDYESYHGYLMKEQTRWEQKIDSLLNLLNHYQTPHVFYE